MTDLEAKGLWALIHELEERWRATAEAWRSSLGDARLDIADVFEGNANDLLKQFGKYIPRGD